MPRHPRPSAATGGRGWSSRVSARTSSQLSLSADTAAVGATAVPFVLSGCAPSRSERLPLGSQDSVDAAASDVADFAAAGGVASMKTAALGGSRMRHALRGLTVQSTAYRGSPLPHCCQS